MGSCVLCLAHDGTEELSHRFAYKYLALTFFRTHQTRLRKEMGLRMSPPLPLSER